MLRVLIMCIASAIICSMLRVLKPELAVAISLAAGVGVVLILWNEYQNIEWLQKLLDTASLDADILYLLVKAAGIGALSEFGSQICKDAGEEALAGRISIASRIAMITLCSPVFIELMDILGTVLP